MANKRLPYLVYVCMCVCVCVCVWCMCACACVCMCMCVRVCVCVHRLTISPVSLFIATLVQIMHTISNSTGF